MADYSDPYEELEENLVPGDFSRPVSFTVGELGDRLRFMLHPDGRMEWVSIRSRPSRYKAYM